VKKGKKPPTLKEQKAGKRNEEMLCIYENQVKVKPEAVCIGQ